MKPLIASFLMLLLGEQSIQQQVVRYVDYKTDIFVFISIDLTDRRYQGAMPIIKASCQLLEALVAAKDNIERFSRIHVSMYSSN